MNKCLFVLFSLVVLVSFGQKDEVKRGDYYLDHFQYYEAALSYKKAYELTSDNFELTFKLAEAYRMYFNYTDAEIYYKIVARGALLNYPMAQFWYAQMLKLKGDYEAAKLEFESLLNEDSLLNQLDSDFNLKTKLEYQGCEMAILELKKPMRDFIFQKIDGDLNTKAGDYAPAIYKNDTSLIFSSTRIEGTLDQQASRNVSNHFHFEKTEIGWSEAFDEDNFYKVMNSKYHDGAGSFTKDHKSYYFTRCDGKQKHSKFKEFNCLIYTSKLEDDNWSSAVPLNENVNMKGQWTANPSISSNGDTLFFVSKRPGGKGMHDIWYSISLDDDQWGPAKNLESVNTPFIDMSPKYDSEDQALFFSSNGRESFGGLDIFVAKGDDFSKIMNVGRPFNSNRDDFYFTLGDSLGYLTSNREDSYLGGDDIYWFTKKSNSEASIVRVPTDSITDAESISISGKILSAETLQPVEDVVGILVGGDGTHLKTTKSNELGKFKFDNLPLRDTVALKGFHYEVLVEEDENSSLLNSSSLLIEDLKIVASKTVPSVFNFENIYFDFNQYELRPEAIKVLESLTQYIRENKNIQVEINANTDNLGSVDYNYHLSKKRGEAVYEYLLAHEVDQTRLLVNALGEESALVSNVNEIGRQLNRRVEFKLIGGGTYSPEARTYVIENQSSLKDIAQRFDMTVIDLKELNGIDIDVVEAFSPLRVRSIGDDDLIEPITLANAQKKSRRYYKRRSKRFHAYKNLL